MSSEAINAVWEYSNARADSKVVMLALADGADDHRLALLRVSFLAWVCRIKESLVR
jgi:hypothetical protein